MNRKRIEHFDGKSSSHKLMDEESTERVPIIGRTERADPWQQPGSSLFYTYTYTQQTEPDDGSDEKCV